MPRPITAWGVDGNGEVEFADDHGTDASYPVADQFKNGLSRFASASICLLQFIPAMNMVALFGLACAPLT